MFTLPVLIVATGQFTCKGQNQNLDRMNHEPVDTENLA